MNKDVSSLSRADQELASIKEQQAALKEIAPFNAVAHVAYEMGRVVEWFQVGKIRNLEKKCQTK